MGGITETTSLAGLLFGCRGQVKFLSYFDLKKSEG